MLKPVNVFAGLITVCLVAQSQAAIQVDLIEGADDPVAQLVGSLTAGSGLTVVAGSEVFVGAVGNGANPNSAQSGLYSNFNLVPNNAGLPTVTMSDGILLTSGTANLPMSNTATAFNPFFPGTGSDAALSALAGSNTNDANSIQFDFTAPAGITSIELDFVFGSDEFPDQEVTDVFGVFVDGVNYAFFPDGSLVSFVQGANAANFIDNNMGTNNYDFEYDGFSNALHLTGILDPNAATHTIKIAIADTIDNVWDSGAFIAGLEGGNADPGGGGGIGNPPGPGGGDIPEPTALLVWGFLMAGAVAMKRRVNG